MLACLVAVETYRLNETIKAKSVTTTELIVERHSSVLPGNSLLYNVSLTRFLNRLYVFIANQFFGVLIISL